VYANRLTAEAVTADPEWEFPVRISWRLFATGGSFAVGDLLVESFSVPHDAYDPVGFVIRHPGSGVAVGMLIQKTTPSYPPIAKAARVSGTVVLQATISKGGTIENLHVISGPAMLQQAALDAAREWRFEPLTFGNQSTSFQAYAIFTFKAENVSTGMWIINAAQEPSSSTNEGSLQPASPATIGGAWVQCSHGLECVATQK